jgi:hypothetical protein
MLIKIKEAQLEIKNLKQIFLMGDFIKFERINEKLK